MRSCFALSLVLLSFVLAAPASAANCSHSDLKGKFTLEMDCEALQNFSGHSQPNKRIVLHGPFAEVMVIEAPQPYRTVPISELMLTLGRGWTEARTPGGVTELQVAGRPALFRTRRTHRNTSRTLVFKLDGVNVTARLTVRGARNAQTAEAMEQLTQSFVAGFKPSS